MREWCIALSPTDRRPPPLNVGHGCGTLSPPFGVVLSLGRGNETTRFHHACRWHDCCVAARGAPAAISEAADHRVLGREYTLDGRPMGRRFCPAIGSTRLDRGSHTIAIEYRWAEGRAERAAEIAAELVRLKVDVIAASGTANTVAAKQATSAVPIVFAAAGDPVGAGLVASLARPGGNVTGLRRIASTKSKTSATKLSLCRSMRSRPRIASWSSMRPRSACGLSAAQASCCAT